MTVGSLLPYPTSTPGSASMGEPISDLVAILGLFTMLIAVSRIWGYANLDTRPAALAAALSLLLSAWYAFGRAEGGPWTGLVISCVGSGIALVALSDQSVSAGDDLNAPE